MRKRRFLRGAHVVGREVRHRVGDLANDGQHRLLQLGFEVGLARREPLAVVVAGEVAEERERFGAEVGSGGGWSRSRRGLAVRGIRSRVLPDHLQRAAEQAVEIGGQRLVFGDGLLDGLLRGGALVAEIDERGEHIVDGRALHG